MHQPFYKDLVTGAYRLPWVRLHALKDYFGMVKLLDEFPDVHQTFNLVPSLMVQIQDYAKGTARDPFLDVASKPARDLSETERRFALDYLFQANQTNLIGRYSRYRELWQMFHGAHGDSARAARIFTDQDFTDLQVLSQIAWFDEFFLAEPEVSALVEKGRGYSLEDQRFVIDKEREIVSAVLPAYEQAAKRGQIEISATPFYHPILPLVCDTDQGVVSHPGSKLPHSPYRYPEDAREQLVRALDFHEKTFGVRPRGVWPSEGSVSEQVLEIAASLGVQWMATDEGVLGRSIGHIFSRDAGGRLHYGGPERLYTPWRFEKNNTRMNMLFRDHTLSDLVGFVYSGMPAAEAAAHFVRSIREAAEPVLRQGRDAVIPIILDGENAWEYYPESGREFLRRVCDALQHDPGTEAVTVSEAIERHRDIPHLGNLVPGSWINANFDVWIGAPEDNKSWDYLAAARSFYAQASPMASPEKRKLAFEELLIAEGSDWNWWYGPEHHTANDRDFDELYRKHLSNVYTTLGAEPPLYLAQPIAGGAVRPTCSPQTAYIHPRVRADFTRYFDWIGAAMYTAERQGGAMHGKVFILDSIFAGIDETSLYGRVDFHGAVPQDDFNLVVVIECCTPAEGYAHDSGPGGARRASVPTSWRLEVSLGGGAIKSWRVRAADSDEPAITSESSSVKDGARVMLYKNFEFQLPLALLGAELGLVMRLRFTVWREFLPLDALPVEGTLDIPVVPEEELEAATYNYSAHS